jgi:hypothetical protein
MSKKEDFLQNITKSKEAHKKAMSKLDMVLNQTLPAKEQEATPISKNECDFGKWFYDTHNIKEYLGLQLYEKIELLHSSWHKQYAQIYNILFANTKKGLLGKIFKQKPDQLEIDKAKAYYDDLKKITQELLNSMDTATRRINALSDSKFN